MSVWHRFNFSKSPADTEVPVLSLSSAGLGCLCWEELPAQSLWNVRLWTALPSSRWSCRSDTCISCWIHQSPASSWGKTTSWVELRSESWEAVLPTHSFITERNLFNISHSQYLQKKKKKIKLKWDLSSLKLLTFILHAVNSVYSFIKVKKVLS